MSDEFETVTVSTRVRKPLVEELDALIEQSEYGNRADALRGLVEEMVGNKATDALEESTDHHTPTSPTLAAVYQHALGTSGRDLVLDPSLLGSVAKAVNNDNSTPLTPSAEAVENYLHRLQSEGYAYLNFNVDLRTGEGGRKWILKPHTAVPDQWTMNKDRVEERQREREVLRLTKILTRQNHRTPEERVQQYREASVKPPEELLEEVGVPDR